MSFEKKDDLLYGYDDADITMLKSKSIIPSMLGAMDRINVTFIDP